MNYRHTDAQLTALSKSLTRSLDRLRDQPWVDAPDQRVVEFADDLAAIREGPHEDLQAVNDALFAADRRLYDHWEEIDADTRGVAVSAWRDLCTLIRRGRR